MEIIEDRSVDSCQEITIVGGGPAGLFCAYLLLKAGHKVKLYDHSSAVGKKFLVAGNGGLNISHSEDLNSFSSRYGKDAKLFKKLLGAFSPVDLRDWCTELGIETFVGTSGRIFPKGLKSVELLSAWIDKLKSNENFKLYLRHKLIGITNEKKLTFENCDKKIIVNSKVVIFALGGASWKITGSDGLWSKVLSDLGVKLSSFRPMNCGFERVWSEFFKREVDRCSLKNIELRFLGKTAKGEMMLTPYGVEGGVIYALSNFIRDELIESGVAKITIDLKPGLSLEALTQKLAKRSKKSTLSNHLRKVLGFDKMIFILLKELLSPEDFEDVDILAKKIKNLEIELSATRPIDEAISTSGGVCFSELNEFLELKAIPGVYFAGEMLDYEAPTGGYLLQGCFSSAWMVVKGIRSKGIFPDSRE
ncbi:MAG: NAD(P)-dependent oxidoreductase [Bacteriovoracaceae bacterium]|nr:NAD(P)-dependent oxidoreductase [Bacteriovoracaceae bacterium]